jgi:UDPglucose--hexose-1-phosphate uridylyltransferase
VDHYGPDFSTHSEDKAIYTCSLQALDLGSLLKTMLQKLSKQLNDPPFNFMIHSAPFRPSSSCLPYAHWFLQIVPQLSVVGGFELGSGCYINPVFPEDAARILRELDCST